MRRALTMTMGAPARPIWTPGYLAFVLPLTPEDVLQDGSDHGGVTRKSRIEWTWIQLAQRLAWQYGEAGALRRLNSYGAPAL